MRADRTEDAPAAIATCGCYDGARFVWEPADDGIASHLCPIVRAIQNATGDPQ